MFDFGMNLKKLRKAKGLTQEQTAELLNVSKQSVSHWENNITYPDISFLPTLASFYCITVDSLLGVDSETNAMLQNQYFAKRQEAHHAGNLLEAFELSQELYTRFPNESAVMSNMMTDSYLMGFHNINGKRKHFLDMSISVSERFLKMTGDIEESCRCIRNIATCHKLLGNQEIAVSWMNKLPSLWSGIENTALDILEGQDRADSIQCSLDAVLHILYQLIWATAENPNVSLQQRIVLLEKIPDLFKLLFENEDYGFYHLFLTCAYEELAKCYLEISREKAILCIREAANHAQKFDIATPSNHTSILFVNHSILPNEWTKSDTCSRSRQLLDTLESAEFDAIREDSELTGILKALINNG